jgi:hypothetical protein
VVLATDSTRTSIAVVISDIQALLKVLRSSITRTCCWCVMRTRLIRSASSSSSSSTTAVLGTDANEEAEGVSLRSVDIVESCTSLKSSGQSRGAAL